MMKPNELLEEAKTLQPQLQKWRRTIHRNPEVGFDLPKTKALVKQALTEMGYAPATVEALLAHWQRKGRIAVEPAPCQGGSCGGCSARACHYYRWLDTPAAPFIAIRSDSSPPPA